MPGNRAAAFSRPLSPSPSRRTHPKPRTTVAQRGRPDAAKGTETRPLDGGEPDEPAYITLPKEHRAKLHCTTSTASPDEDNTVDGAHLRL